MLKWSNILTQYQSLSLYDAYYLQRQNSDIQVEKTGKHHFNQMIKVKGSNNWGTILKGSFLTLFYTYNPNNILVYTYIIYKHIPI